MDPSFLEPAPERWEPQIGDPVRILYGGKIFEGKIMHILEESKTFVVESPDLLLPVCCGRDSLRPIRNL